MTASTTYRWVGSKIGLRGQFLGARINTMAISWDLLGFSANLEGSKLMGSTRLEQYPTSRGNEEFITCVMSLTAHGAADASTLDDMAVLAQEWRWPSCAYTLLYTNENSHRTKCFGHSFYSKSIYRVHGGYINSRGGQDYTGARRTP